MGIVVGGGSTAVGILQSKGVVGSLIGVKLPVIVSVLVVTICGVTSAF